MGAAFLSAARQGKNQWWRYVLGILVTGFFWVFLGSIPLVIWALFDPQIITQPTTPIAQVWQYTAVSLSFVFFLLGLFITVKTIHQRRFLTLIQANAAVAPKRIFQGASVWAVLMAISYGIEAIFFPSHFTFTFNATAWLLLVPIALVLTSIQSATEELFFRGYLLQGLGLLSQHRWLLILVTSAIFAVLHFGNPEVSASNSFLWITLHYFAIGLFFALITLKDNSLELAIGAHAANNLFLGMLISPNVSVLNTPAVVTHTVNADAQIDFFLFLLQASVFYFFIFSRNHNKIGRPKRLPR